MQDVLASLRDVQGVIGAFLLDEDGRLIARDMPAMFDDNTLASASARISQLRAAFELGSEQFEGCTARFGSHLVMLRPAEARSLCVICPVDVNLTMLEMGLNLITRRVAAPKTERVSFPPPPPIVDAAPAPSSAISSEAAAVRPSSPPPAPSTATPSQPGEPMGERTRFFRGRPVR